MRKYYENNGKLASLSSTILIEEYSNNPEWEEITEAEYLARLSKEEEPNPNLIRIAELKANLADSDYKLFKYLEGAMSKEEYIPIMRQRQAWRDEINKLEENNNAI